MYGWTGTILRVDLSSGTIEKEPLSDRLRLNYLGGRGINSRILYDGLKPGVDALSPENRLIFGTGPIVGTVAPSSSRLTVTAKSPLTGIVGYGNAGGGFSPELKWAGYDHIVFTGKAERPVYLRIENDLVELRAADHLWGKTTHETEDEIRRELGDSTIKIASIGLGGENLVRYATIILDSYCSGGRPGMGAVMGSKNLKAVAVKGTKGVQVPNPEAFMQAARDLSQRIVNQHSYKGIAYFGTPYITMQLYRWGWQPCKNSLTFEWPEIEKLGHKLLKRDYYVKSLACSACPRHCSQAWIIKEGPYSGLQGGKVDYVNISTLGCGSLISDFAAIAKMTSLCNEYSIDILELGNIVNAAMEWYQEGLITKKDTDGIELNWGNAEAVIQIIHKVARREGFGNLLANGALRAAKAIGKGAEKYISCHSKGMTEGSQDVRPTKGYALSVATSTRGADHLSGQPIYEQYPGLTTPEISRERFGTVEACVPGSYKKASLVVHTQHVCTLADCLGICKFSTEWGAEVIGIKEASVLFSLTTGVETDEKAMSAAAERVFNVERAFSVREGMTRKDDVVGGKWGNEPIPDGPSKGERIDRKKFNKLLDEFYELRGWDSAGIPTSVKLSALGLEDIDAEMQRARLTAARAK